MKHTIMYLFITVFLVISLGIKTSVAKDTLRVSLHEFITAAINESDVLKAREQNTMIANSRYQEARASKYLPRFELTTAHGLVPGVRSTSSQYNFSDGQLYLDPSLRNDWENWALFTRAEINAIQPIYSWGAVNRVLEATREATRFADFEYQSATDDYALRLVELYYSYLLAIELNRLVLDARKDLNKAEERLNELLEDDDHDLEEADIFKFNIYKYEFYKKADEVEFNLTYLQEAWNLALGNTSSHVVYQPSDRFLDPFPHEIREFQLLEMNAVNNHPDAKKVEAATLAANHGLHAARAQQYPTLILGFTAAYAITPNRPKQENPFIINSTNYESVRYGLGVRQNLNIGILRAQVNRSEHQLKQANYAKEAMVDGIKLGVREKYKAYLTAKSQMDNTAGALQISNEWLRVEQLDYDLGFGDVKNLIEAVRTNLELEVTYKQKVFDYNLSVARLYHASGLNLTETLTH